MSYLFQGPKFRALDANGDIMPGAKLLFYATSTTTPEDTYSDSGLTTPHANPVIADSSGEFPAIYLDPSVTYRVILLDADDVEYWDIDPYAPPRDFVPGTIIIFHGNATARDAAYPPATWQVCDGTNGSPDARDRFLIGAGSTYDSGDSGGSGPGVNTSAAGGHDHGGAVSAESLTAAQMPSHRHRLLGTTGAGIVDSSITSANVRGIGAVRNNTSGPYVDATPGGEEYVEDTGSGNTHDHDVTAVADHIHTVTVDPPRIAVWFLMRRAV